MVNKWTEEDVLVLKEKYSECGSNIPELFEKYPKYTIRWKAQKLGLKCKHRGLNAWTQEEIEKLKKEYFENSSELEIPGRTYAAIKTKCSALKIKSSKVRRWNKADIEILKKEYPKERVNIPELLKKGYSKIAITKKAKHLGIWRPTRKKAVFWTDKEIEILKEKYAEYGPYIPELLEKHSKNEIYNKAYKLGIHMDTSVFDYKGNKYETLKQLIVQCGFEDNCIYFNRLKSGWAQKYASIPPQFKMNSCRYSYKNLVITYVTCAGGVPYFKCKCNLCGLEKILSFDEIEAHADTCSKKEELE